MPEAAAVSTIVYGSEVLQRRGTPPHPQNSIEAGVLARTEQRCRRATRGALSFAAAMVDGCARHRSRTFSSTTTGR